MPIINEQLELERSQEFFTDPQSYTAFDLDESERRILGCIDPRDQVSDRLLTVVQTPGGGVGSGLDRSIARTAITGEAVTFQESVTVDRNVRPSFILSAHYDCKLAKSVPAVLDEMANPTPFTEFTAERWIDYYGLYRDITRPVLSKVQDAAKKLQEEKYKEYEEEELLNSVSRLYDAENLVTMAGENRARIYMVNHHPNVGLDRQKKHRGENPLKVQGYHDSLGATVDELRRFGLSRRSHEQRKYVLGAHVLKAAAVRSVIGDAGTYYYEGYRTARGLRVVEAEKND